MVKKFTTKSKKNNDDAIIYVKSYKCIHLSKNVLNLLCFDLIKNIECVKSIMKMEWYTKCTRCNNNDLFDSDIDNTSSTNKISSCALCCDSWIKGCCNNICDPLCCDIIFSLIKKCLCKSYQANKIANKKFIIVLSLLVMISIFYVFMCNPIALYLVCRGFVIVSDVLTEKEKCGELREKMNPC